MISSNYEFLLGKLSSSSQFSQVILNVFNIHFILHILLYIFLSFFRSRKGKASFYREMQVSRKALYLPKLLCPVNSCFTISIVSTTFRVRGKRGVQHVITRTSLHADYTFTRKCNSRSRNRNFLSERSSTDSSLFVAKFYFITQKFLSSFYPSNQVFISLANYVCCNLPIDNLLFSKNS